MFGGPNQLRYLRFTPTKRNLQNYIYAESGIPARPSSCGMLWPLESWGAGSSIRRLRKETPRQDRWCGGISKNRRYRMRRCSLKWMMNQFSNRNQWQFIFPILLHLSLWFLWSSPKRWPWWCLSDQLLDSRDITPLLQWGLCLGGLMKVWKGNLSTLTRRFRSCAGLWSMEMLLTSWFLMVLAASPLEGVHQNSKVSGNFCCKGWQTPTKKPSGISR